MHMCNLMNIHPLLASYPLTTPHGDDTFWYTFIGSKVRKEFVAWSPPPNAAPDDQSVSMTPDILGDRWQVEGEELFEFIDLAESAKAAKDAFTVADLGAGFGRWLVYAELFRQVFNPTVKGKYIGIEGDPTHYAWMVQHFKDNGLDPADHDLRCAVVANKKFVRFMKNTTPAEWYGQGICQTFDPDIPASLRWALSLPTILKPYEKIDLIDADLQGIELDVFLPAINVLNHKVARIHIGTHSPEIESGMRDLFTHHGWIPHWDFAGMGVRQTPYGAVSFQDGAQSWINPRWIG